jgi:hypothetical protein
MGRINVPIDDELHRKVKAFSAMHSMTLIEYLNIALEEKLKREKL